MINIPGLDTSRWTRADYAAFWQGFFEQWVRGNVEDLILKAAPASKWAKRITSRRYLQAKRWFG